MSTPQGTKTGALTMTKLSTGGRETAEAIRDHREFSTHGALSAIAGSWQGSGRLTGEDLARWYSDYGTSGLIYAVYSYATPIAWVRADGQVYRVKAKFSVTTSKHQGTLYLLGEEGSH
jgi:hypothetical protein